MSTLRVFDGTGDVLPDEIKISSKGVQTPISRHK